MSVLYDYFRAVDDTLAGSAVNRPGGPLATDSSGTAFDGVAARGIDPVVTLGQLVAFIGGVSWTPDLVGSEEIARSTISEAWVERLAPSVLDRLAGAADDALPEIVVKWSQSEDFVPVDDPDESQLLALVTDLVTLARRARAAGDQVYCWCCL